MAQIQEGMLILCRILSFMVIGPVFADKNFPRLARVGFGIALTLLVWPVATGFHGAVTPVVLSLLAIKEVVFGLTMGYISKLVFNAVLIAGQFIDFQIGFLAGQLYDPTFQTSMSQYGRLYYWLAMCVFFITGLHRLLIHGILLSFKVVPLGTFKLTGNSIDGITQLFVNMFTMGASLAAPLVVALVAIDIMLGFISRTVPQLNVLMMSLPVKQALGFLITLILLPSIVSVLNQYLPSTVSDMWDFVKSMR